MFSKNSERLKHRLNRLERERALDLRLDEIGRDLVRAAQISDAEIKETVTSPFLYPRLRARIAAGQERLDVSNGSNWWALLLTTWQPLAGMALMATFAAALFLFTVRAEKTATDLAMSGNDYLATGESNFERIVFTGGEAPSNDDVLTTLMNQDETDAQR